MKQALIGINLQIDFFPGGALGLDDNQISTEVINNLAEQFDHRYLVLDWHPGNHISFAGSHLWRYPGQTLERAEGNIRLWFIHAVGGSFGAELHPRIKADLWQDTFRKGQDPQQEQLSGWEAVNDAGRSIADQLTAEKIERVYLIGMCLDHDVLTTALDARKAGLEVVVLEEVVSAANQEEGDAERALATLEQAGVLIQSVREIR